MITVNVAFNETVSGFKVFDIFSYVDLDFSVVKLTDFIDRVTKKHCYVIRFVVSDDGSVKDVDISKL